MNRYTGYGSSEEVASPLDQTEQPAASVRRKNGRSAWPARIAASMLVLLCHKLTALYGFVDFAGVDNEHIP